MPTLHIAYHLGEHYNSVRRADDPGDGPAISYPVSHLLQEVELPDPVEEEKKEKKHKQALVAALKDHEAQKKKQFEFDNDNGDETEATRDEDENVNPNGAAAAQAEQRDRLVSDDVLAFGNTDEQGPPSKEEIL